MKELPAHSSRSIAIGSVVGGIVILAWSGGDTVGLACGIALLGGGVWQWRHGMALQLLNASSAAINRGELAAARELVAVARARHRLPWVRRFLDAQEVTIAWVEGDLREAARAIARARGNDGWFERQSTRAARRANLEGRRALVSALIDDEASTNEAVATVRKSGGGPRAVAEAELAHAVSLARRGEHDALRAHLARWHVLLIEALDAKGRALHRALRKTTQRGAASAYRVPASSAPAASGRGTALWLERVFPEGAGLVEFDDGANIGDWLAAPTDAAQPRPIRAVKRRSTRRVARIVAMLSCVPATFVAVWATAVAMRERLVSAAVAQLLMIGLACGLLALFVAILVLMVRRAGTEGAKVARAQWLVLAGELDRADAELQPLRESENARVAASASLVLADIFLRRAELDAALAECERGMGVLATALVLESADDLFPSFVATRAMLLGALGRDAESDAELVRLSREFPTFVGAPSAVVSTKLVRAVRSGDLAQARELARVRGDVVIGAYDDALAELAIADGAADREDRLAALREELSTMPSLDRWVRTIAPSVLQDRGLGGSVEL